MPLSASLLCDFRRLELERPLSFRLGGGGGGGLLLVLALVRLLSVGALWCMMARHNASG